MSGKSVVTLGLVTLLALAVAGCGGNDQDARPGVEDGAPSAIVEVELTEFQVAPDTESAQAGAIEFEAANSGTVAHEFVVIRTDLSPGELPVEGGVVDESAEDLDIVGQIEPFDPNVTQSRSFEMEPASYVLICNISGHYQAGMHAAFTVE